MCKQAIRQAKQATRQLLDAMVTSGHTPGVQYLFTTSTQTHLSHHAGLADPHAKTPVTEHTTFNLYSVTKTLTALAILRLAEQGRIDLDSPVGRYVDRWPQIGAATVRQTLLHIAGFANPNPLSWVHLADEDAAFDRQQFIDNLMRTHGTPVRRPGQRYSYSNVGYVLLGELIARVSGQPYAHFAKQQFLAPLGLAEHEILSFDIADAETHARGAIRRMGWLNLMLGFMIDRQRLVEQRTDQWLTFRHHQVDGDAYGGLVGNAQGLGKYLLAVLHGGDLISAASRALLTSTANTIGPSRSLGWFTGRLEGEPWCAHAGGGAGYYCEARLYPQLGGASVVMFNRAGVRDERILDRIDRQIVSSIR